MSEDYNSPQSVYWCLKTFIIIGLPEDHPFWACEELPHPLDATARNSSIEDGGTSISQVSVIWPPRHILCNMKQHHFLISSGQSTAKHHRAREAKYGKLAYSSGFGFSVPTGPLLEQLAPDSTICLTLDDGDTWLVRCNPFDVHLYSLRIVTPDMARESSIEIPALRSTWKPKNTGDLLVETTLVPPVKQWPGWHLRIHRLKWKPKSFPTGNATIRLVDSGFAAPAQARNGFALAKFQSQPDTTTRSIQTEGWLTEDNSCLIYSDRGSSGVVDLTQESQYADTAHRHGIHLKSAPLLLRPDANTNLISQRTLIPSIEHHIAEDKSAERVNVSTSPDDAYRETWLITGIFAITNSSVIDAGDIEKFWCERPNIRLSTRSNKSPRDFEIVQIC